ncbi:extracellular solute-binding protein [Bordetella sp. 2513F-2]
MPLQKCRTLVASLVLATTSLGASAADLTVTAYGGVWEKVYRECFVQPFEAKTGKKVDVILGSPMQWVNQISANPSKPPIDVIVGLADTGLILSQRGLVEPISAKEIPNLEHLKPHMVDYGNGYGFPIAYGNFGLMYSKSRVKNPPTSWQEFVEGTVKGDWQAALPGISYVGTVQGLIGLFANLYGGNLENVQPGLDQVKRMSDSGNVIFYSEPNSPLVAMKSGDIDIAMYFDGRAWAEHDANNPDIAYLDPKPGAVSFPTMVQKVKNGSPLGFDFMNVIASDEGQTCFANKMGYSASSKNVKYEDRVKPRVASDDTSLWLPFPEIARNTPSWVELWNKQIGR